VADPLTGPVVHPGPFGLGCAQLGNLFQAISDNDAFDLLDELFPACARRGVSVLNAGVFNSGVLASPEPSVGATERPLEQCVLELADRKPNPPGRCCRRPTLPSPMSRQATSTRGPGRRARRCPVLLPDVPLWICDGRR
jgi:hypothetical protein